MTTPLEIAEVAGARAFGSKLVTNVFRGMIAEAVVASILCPEWTWCSEDYFRYDFVHPSGVGLEVKQSAACQSWSSKKPSRAVWDIAERQGYYEGETYIVRPGRHAGIYVLAWHAEADRERTDHRDPQQWVFYVVRASQLPAAKTIGQSAAARLVEPVGIGRLKHVVTMCIPELGAGEVSFPAQEGGPAS